MRLTFDQGKFIFEDGGLNQVSALLSSPLSKEWTAINPDDYATINPQAAVSFRRFADEKAEALLRKIFIQFYDAPTLPQLAFLDSHQVDGINWVLSRSRSYIAHAPGAGKTLQAIVSALLTKGEGQTLFIVPPTLTINWEREIIKWTHWTGHWPTISIVPTTNREANHSWRAEFIICPDSMLTKDWVLTNLMKLKIKFLAVDEASRFKESTSARTIALFGGETKKFKSSGLIYNTKHSVLMDGSPMPNRPMELWAPVTAMAPEVIDFMSHDDFGYRYCGATRNEFGRWEFKNSSREEELKEKLQKNFMHVVTEDKLNHPERRRHIVFMSEDPRTAQMKEWQKSILKHINFDDIDDDLDEGHIANYRRELGIRKVPWITEHVKFRLEKPNEQILLFVWHREVAHLLMAGLKDYKPCLVIGGTESTSREDSFASFQRGTSRLIIGNISSMGRGHNLQNATRVVFGEFSWTDETNKQAEKRASRKGSTKNFVPCEYIVAPGTLDEPVLNAVFTKQSRTKRIIG